ncbi:ubiquitin carboxyl-terminal hydrolase 34 [Fusarium subglutinans]|uniref:Ubiquitin carboxyl-terminal hydrolase 34 n=1 Tax=Gibberella subglutinans TaxID=42677 RepID=A0A8H5PDQ0_GIBSU|nr:ubiquitin carboxyl-terminal hydrolase 34 [Fusarium subglutinans]KAF5594822.1 ubiquitin carboxyl-terminal hydrolase 34 [Fusarium subglutinans]
MDPASRSPALPDRAASAEASSTRPNPFDDSNISSRKRQRTSLSGSPTNSHSTLNPGHDSSRSATLDTEPVLPRPGSTTAYSQPDSVAPKTSDTGSPVCDPLTEPPSSMATLNLRNAPENDSTSSPPPPPNVAQSVAAETTDDALKDQVKESVEDAEVAMVPPPQNLGTPRSSFSHSASPPIEVITVQSDDDMASDRQSIGVSIVDDDSVMIDPINEFPFREPTETLEGMLVRLCNYIETQSSIDAGAIYKLQQWLRRYLDYIATANQQLVVDSCRLNHVFWMTFPRIITAMAAHRPPFLADDLLRHHTEAVFLDFARLSAWFVNQDIHTIKEFIAEQGGRGQQTVELFCPCYLQNLHSIINPLLLSDDQYQHFGALSMAFLKAYQDSPGGSLSRLLQLTKALFQVIPTYPRLTNDLAPICLVASDIMEGSCNFVTPEIAFKSNQKLLIGHTLLDLIHERLDIMIDKSPTHLVADSVLVIVQALSNMINIALKGDHAAAILMLERHRTEFPAVPLRYTAEAISYEHRFQFLIKLIKSSQMQLRFQGMTQMCKELIAFWKKHLDSKADDGSHYVEHIAEYLIRTGFIDYLLGANCHPEIIVEGANIIGFIIVTRRYRRTHIDRFWEGITSRQDPRTADALARMVIQVAHLFDDDGLLLLCEKFQTLPIDAFTPAIRMLWEGVMKNMAEKCSEDCLLAVQPYNLCLRLLRDSSVCASGSQVMYPDIQQAVMQKFIDLLRCGPDAEGQQQLYLGCLQDLANKSATTLGSLWCLFIALRSREMSREMRGLVEHHGLTRLVIEELEHAIGAGQAAGIPAVLSCSVNQPRREFIANLIQLEPPSITEDLGVKLWDMLVGPTSLSPDDRRVGWEILNSLRRKNKNGNSFLQACLTYHLPALSSEYFCEGMLEFLRIEILPRLNDNFNLALDDPEVAATSGIEQLWRLILEAEDETLVDRAIRTLAVDVYIDSRFFNSISTQRAQSAHLKLASRCLEQLKSAAQELRNTSQSTNSDDQVVVTTITQRQLQQQERIFTRSLKFLRYILEAHQSKPSLSAPDLRTLIPQASHEVQGDPAGLKYQSFDGDQQTDIKPLVIGRANTAASLLASLRQETGFDNYRIYYRGRPFLPNIFPSGQPFKSLYAVHALIEYAETLLPSQLTGQLNDVATGSGSDPVILPEALKTPISFIVQAISDEDIFNGASVFLRLKLASTLLHALRQFLDRVGNLRGSVPPQGLPLPDPNRSREYSMVEYFWKVTSAMVRQTTVFPSQCEELFRLVHFLVLKINARLPELLDIEKFASQISQLLLDHTTTELDNSVAQSKTLPSNLAMSLVWKHLYPPKDLRSGQPVPKVILNEETRAKLSDVLFTLVKHDQKKTVAVVEALEEQVPFFDDEEDDHYIYDLNYHFDRHRALRAPCGYTGLLNLSNTCYLNSLMTQLFMNTTFRRFILGCRINDPANSQQLLSYTQKLFGHMQESYRRFVDPSNFVHSIKTYDDALIDIHNQMDVDEFYNLLLDRWETQLSGHDEKRVIKSFYGGQLVQQVKSKECEHISERLEPFSAIQCDIKGKGTLAESLQAYVDGEVMEGDNKYKCSTCDRHVDAVKRACLKDVPDNVIFHLKRFDFNLRTLQRSKINDYFSFPDQIDMRPYTIEHLSNPKSDIEEDIFELVGVLVHAGTAESGHYYSYIRERPTSSNRPLWVEFNDDLVTPWDPAQMEYSTFGGTDQRPIYDNNGILYDKNFSAYMLFYQRSSSLRAEQEKMSVLAIPAPLRVDVPDHLADHLSDENTNILRRHCIYDPSNVKLVQVLFRQSRQHCRSIGRSEKSSSINSFMAMRSQEHGLQDLAMRTLIGNLDQVVARTKDAPDFLSYEETIEDAVTSCERCAFSFYEYFNQHPSAFRMLLQRNPDQLVRSKIKNLFKVAVSKISTALPNVYDPEIRYKLVHDADGDETLSEPDASQRSVIDGVMMIFQHLWKFFHIHIRAWDEYFGAVLDFAAMGHRETGYVLAANFLASAIRIISADPLQELSGNWARMLQSVIRRNNTTKHTSYVSIIRLVSHLMSQMRPQIGTEYVEDPTERVSQLAEAFSWTFEEVDLVYSSPNGSYTSLFVEKLLTLDQEHAGCNNIIRILTKLDSSMDEKVLGTLKLCIRGETSTQAMDPFLQASITYLESTEQLSNAKDMIEHVSMQAKSLQNTEGVYFVQLFRTALDLRQQDREFCKEVQTFSRDLIPRWVPFLLASPEEQVRRSTHDFLVCELGKIDADATSDRDVTVDDQVSIRQMMKQIGVICLQYLRDHHVRRRAQISREIADKFLKVIEGCAATVTTTADIQPELDVELLSLQDDVLNPFRRLIVDELEEDGSGMNEMNDLEQMS